MARVLVVDDEKGMRRTLEKFLLRAEHEVFTAESFDEAKQIISSHNLDVVVSDILLNGPTGIDVLKFIREVAPDIKTIMITGHPELETTVQGMRLGAFDYISKPISGKHLVEVVNEAAKIKQQIDEDKSTIKQQEGFLRAMIDNLPLQFWAIDRDFRINMQNSKSIELWGNKLGYKLDDADTTQYSKEFAEYCSKAFEGESIQFTTTFPKNDNFTLKSFRHNIAPVIVDNKIISVVGVSKDITKETQDKTELTRFANVLKSTSQGVILLDLEGKILNVNDAACKMYRVTREDVIGNDVFSFLPQNTSPIAKERFKNVLERNPGKPHEYTIINTEGLEIEIEILTTAIIDENDEVIGVSAIGQDITERKKTENALRESEELHKQLVNLLPEALILTNCDNKLTYVSNVFLELFGYDNSEEVLGKDIMDFFPKEKHQELKQTVELVYNSIDIQDKIYPLIKADGSHIWCEIEADIFHDKNGNIKGLITVLHDLTNRLRMENAIRNNEQRFRELAELLPEIVYEMDMSGMVTFASDEAFNITGYTKEDITKGFSAACLFVEEDREDALKNIKLMLSDPDSVNHREYKAQRKDGSTFPVVTRSVPIVRNGRIEGIRGIIFDLTEQKKAEDKQKQLQKHIAQTRHLESLAQMAGGIAHDFNNLLTGILGNATLAKMDIAPDDQAYENLNDIEQAAENATELVQKMLAYSGKGIFNLQEGNVSDIVKQSVISIHPPLSNSIKLNITLDNDLPKSNIDKSQIQQLVTSLITNAAEAIENNGTISVRTGYKFFEQSYLNNMYLTHILKEGYYIYLDIEDSGCGFAEQEYTKIFDPFYSTKFLGRGMGLAAVLGIVRGHGGGISVVSEPNKGSLFRILFVPKLSKDQTEHTPEKTDTHEVTQVNFDHPTILIVDDEPLVLKLARKTLLMEGYRVLMAKDGFEALEIFEKNYQNISGVLLDLTMPKKNGKETFKEMIAIDKNVKVILTSGYSEEEVIRLFPTNQLGDFIHKPFKPDELIFKVRQLITK